MGQFKRFVVAMYRCDMFLLVSMTRRNVGVISAPRGSSERSRGEETPPNNPTARFPRSAPRGSPESSRWVPPNSPARFPRPVSLPRFYYDTTIYTTVPCGFRCFETAFLSALKKTVGRRVAFLDLFGFWILGYFEHVRWWWCCWSYAANNVPDAS